MYESPQQSQNCELWEPVVVFITALICSVSGAKQKLVQTQMFEDSSHDAIPTSRKWDVVENWMKSFYSFIQKNKCLNWGKGTIKKQQGHFEFFWK